MSPVAVEVTKSTEIALVAVTAVPVESFIATVKVTALPSAALPPVTDTSAMVALVIVPAALAALVSSVTPVWPVTVEIVPVNVSFPSTMLSVSVGTVTVVELLPAVIVSAVDPLAVLDTAV